ncbi:hypothetical protein WH5701_10185 [Synechococcus sp. WH 5701]|nr:hypothetical protein WH5701_10185 [Synechococcus sp. WH 5701]
MQQRQHPLPAQGHPQDRQQQQQAGRQGEEASQQQLLAAAQASGQQGGSAFGHQHHVVGADQLDRHTHADQQRQRQGAEAIQLANPAGGFFPASLGGQQIPNPQRQQSPGADQIQAGAVVAALLHGQQQAVAHGQHQGDHRGDGEDPAQQEQPPPAQGIGPEQQQQQQSDVDRAEADAAAVGEQLSPERGIGHGAGVRQGTFQRRMTGCSHSRPCQVEP